MYKHFFIICCIITSLALHGMEQGKDNLYLTLSRLEITNNKPCLLLLLPNNVLTHIYSFLQKETEPDEVFKKRLTEIPSIIPEIYLKACTNPAQKRPQDPHGVFSENKKIIAVIKASVDENEKNVRKLYIFKNSNFKTTIRYTLPDYFCNTIAISNSGTYLACMKHDYCYINSLCLLNLKKELVTELVSFNSHHDFDKSIVIKFNKQETKIGTIDSCGNIILFPTKIPLLAEYFATIGVCKNLTLQK